VKWRGGIYVTIDYNGKRYVVTRSGHVATVVLRHKKDGKVMVIHRRVHKYSTLGNKIRNLAGVKLNESDMWE
jgi:hypothetical protein